MADTNQMPREEGIDHSLSLMREGYMYILNRRKSFNSDIFETQLLGKKAICMVGNEAAKVFMTLKIQKKRCSTEPGGSNIVWEEWCAGIGWTRSQTSERNVYVHHVS